jgi:hypothetical protein
MGPIGNLPNSSANEQLKKTNVENSIFAALENLEQIKVDISTKQLTKQDVVNLIQSGSQLLNDKLGAIKAMLGEVKDTVFRELKQAVTNQIDAETKDVLQDLEKKKSYLEEPNAQGTQDILQEIGKKSDEGPNAQNTL